MATECAQSSRLQELTALDGAREIFGDPLYPDDAEHQDVQVLRDELAAPGDKPTSHLGEAETIAIIVRRQLVCFFTTDDRDAARLAAKNGIRTADTWLLLRVASRKGWLDADTLWGYVRTLKQQGRGSPRGVGDRPAFDKWLAT